MSVTQFYSYLWLREDGSPYYAGKGSGQRAFKNSAHNVHRPKDRSRIIVFSMLSEAEAFESEIALIDLFGRKDLGTGCLRNVTNGGEGASGHRHTSEAKAAIGAASRGNKWGVGNKNHFGYTHTPEAKAKMAAKKIGGKNGFGDPAKAAAQAERARGVPRPPEVMAKMVATRRAREHYAVFSPEAKKRMSRAGTKLSPATREKMRTSQKARLDRKFLKTVAWG